MVLAKLSTMVFKEKYTCSVRSKSYALTLHYMGGWIPPPLQFLVPGAFQSDLRGSKFWYNSLLVLTMQVINFENLKGVPKKIWSMFFEAGVKNQKFKVGPIGLKFSGGL